ncbi:hypothetical protein J7L05_11560 [bacterium]|nr:hypothetical protein [bacterium]
MNESGNLNEIGNLSIPPGSFGTLAGNRDASGPLPETGVPQNPPFSVILSAAKDLFSIAWINFIWFNHQHSNL